MARKLKPSERVLLWSFGGGTVLSIGVWWLIPGGPWWVYAVVAIILGGMIYPKLLGHFADEAQVDRDHK